jgi:hypothetical protein
MNLKRKPKNQNMKILLILLTLSATSISYSQTTKTAANEFNVKMYNDLMEARAQRNLDKKDLDFFKIDALSKGRLIDSLFREINRKEAVIVRIQTQRNEWRVKYDSAFSKLQGYELIIRKQLEKPGGETQPLSKKELRLLKRKED